MAVPASRVSRVVMTGPLAGFAEAYVLELRRRGYTPLTSVNQLRQVGRLSSWLATQGVGVAELTRERVEEFLAVQRAVGRHRSQWSRPGLLCLMEVLAGLSVIGAEPRRELPRPPMSCWTPSRTTCAPNALWPPARSASTWITRAVSWPGATPRAGPG